MSSNSEPIALWRRDVRAPFEISVVPDLQSIVVYNKAHLARSGVIRILYELVDYRAYAAKIANCFSNLPEVVETSGERQSLCHFK